MSAKMVGQRILKKLNDAGYDAYFIGGMVRDTLLGRDVYDADITTSATPEDILNLFEKAIPTGLKHGTVTVVADGENIEVTTFRLDGDYLDHRHPEKITFTDSLYADLARRDFTVNAIAKDVNGRITDPFNGKADLEAGIIRAVGTPEARFKEDALRILRGIRFVAKLGFDVEEETLKAMKSCRNLLPNLSFERIRKELEGIIEGAHRVKALTIMRDYNLFKSLPFWDTFDTLKDEEIIKLDDFRLMTLLIQEKDRAANSNAFFRKFPLTRHEKKLIENVEKALDFREVGNARSKLVQYYFGTETLEFLMKYETFHHTPSHNKENLSLSFNLPIQNRRDLALKPKEVINLFDRESGPWVNQLFTEMERKVVLGELANRSKELLTFIKESVIFDVKEN